ncbi:MAG TPA: hypothetical protein VHP83_17580, partial [Aggregatilineaceae bacterium]|nr:hypothetical protein [Aggregatilineaceae bacterium]
NLQPVLLLEGSTETGTTSRLGRGVTIAPGETFVFRWVLGGMPERDASLMVAHRWLNTENWDAHIAAIEERAQTVPQIETGHADWDAALAWGQQIVLRSFFAPTGSLPNPSFVLTRKIGQGYAVSGTHPAGFGATWGGQTIPDALAISGTVAIAAPELAKGIVRNFIAVQHGDGTIDAKPGLDGQRAGVLAPPLLATLALAVYQNTGDKEFLAECMDGLRAFFERWFKPDLDRDRDGMPEWSKADQGAFVDSPTLAQNRRWSQGLDITTIETPDLAAYLVREASTLIRIAKLLNRPDDVKEIQGRLDEIEKQLDAMWHADSGTFRYRDRDTHRTPAGETIFEAKGDQALRDFTALVMPSRLILRVNGGMNYKPKVGCTIEGVDFNGKPANETVNADAFDWYRNSGAATTKTVWKEIKYLKFDGLSRVYNVQVGTVNLTRHDQALLMPLWTNTISKKQVEQTVALISDPAMYWQEYGVPGCPANDPAFDPMHLNGCGGMFPAWNERIAWALIEHGYIKEAAELFQRVIKAQVASLQKEQHFRAFYNSQTGEGLGDTDVISGVPSVGWFARLFGAHALGADQVIITGAYGFDEKMTWKQHGVSIQRDPNGTTIRFPSGHEAKLDAGAKPQVVRDPKAKKAAPKKPPAPKPATPPVITSEGETPPETP